MNIDQYTAIDRVSETRALDFMGLKNDVTVRENDRRAEPTQPFQYLNGPREQAVGKRIVDEEG